MKRIKDNKFTVIITTIFLLLPVFAGMILWDKLPENMPIHFGADGEVDGYASKLFAIFGFAAMLFGVQLLLMITMGTDPKNQGISDKIYSLSLWLVPIINVAAQTAILLTAMQYKVNIEFIFMLVIGLIYVLLGNVMPKARKNYTFGFRIRWALDSSKNWDHTHRVGGWCMAACGLVMILLGLCSLSDSFPSGLMIIAIFVLLVIATAIPSVYSYVYYTKHKDDADYYASEE